MSDRGGCWKCGKPSIRVGSGWVCPDCGSERPYDANKEAKVTEKPSIWRRGGSKDF